MTNIILIGCGAVAELLYAPALKVLASQGLYERILAIDRSDARIGYIKAKLPQVETFRSLSEVESSLDRDLAVVALPHNLHAAASVEALRRGAHVLCEKPMACTSKECALMINAAKDVGRQLAVGHFRRFFPATQEIRRWIEREHLGRLRSFRFLEGEIYSWPAASPSFFTRESAGGGVLIDAGSHTVDLILWWAGAIEGVQYWDDAVGGVEANCVLNLTMVSGAKGFVQMSRDWPLSNRYFFDFEDGWLLYECDRPTSFQWGWHGENVIQKVELLRSAGLGFDRLPKSGRDLPNFSACFELQLRNVMSAISGNEALMCSGDDGKKTIAFIEGCYRARQPLPQLWLPDTEQAAIRRLVSV